MTPVKTDEQQLISDAKAIWNNPDIPDTTKERLVLSRVGQGLFRKRVKMFEQKCRVTDIQDDNYLIASHIKPWARADDHERLDGNNGLLLSPHIDRLFVRGYMTFSKMEMYFSATNSIKKL
jgi:putative restriction endonuclease